MTKLFNALAAGLASLAFAVALAGMMQMAATSAKAVAAAHVAPVYGQAMLDPGPDAL